MITKKAILFGLFLLYGSVLMAQNSNVSKAKAAAGKKDFSKALELINLATEHPKTKEKPNTYYQKALILKQMYLQADSLKQENADKLRIDFLATIQKTRDIEKKSGKSGKFDFLLNQEISGLSQKMFNVGFNAYKSKDYQKSYEAFKNSYELDNSNLSSLTNMIQIGQQNLGKTEELEPFYDVVMKQDSVSLNSYRTYIQLLAYDQDKYDKAIPVITKAMEDYPDDKDLPKYKFDIYKKAGKLETAIKEIEERVKKASIPEISDLIQLGALYSEQGKNEEAKKMFLKADKINPNSFQNLQNLAIITFNEAVEINKSINDLSDADYRKHAKEYRIKAINLWKESAEYLERANKIKPDDKDTLEMLHSIYGVTQQKEKLDRVNANLKKIGVDMEK